MVQGQRKWRAILTLGAAVTSSWLAASDLPEIQQRGNLRVVAVPFEGMPEFMVRTGSTWS